MRYDRLEGNPFCEDHTSLANDSQSSLSNGSGRIGTLRLNIILAEEQRKKMNSATVTTIIGVALLRTIEGRDAMMKVAIHGKASSDIAYLEKGNSNVETKFR